MAKQDDMQKLMARETRRRESIVGSLAGIITEETPSPAPIPVANPTPEPAQAPTTPASSGLGVIRPPSRETRTARKQIVITPTLEKRVARKCNERKISLNEVVNQLLQKWVDAEDA